MGEIANFNFTADFNKSKGNLWKNQLPRDVLTVDLDGDGVLTPEEIEAAKLLKEAESAEEKADTQKRMAWIAMISMLGFTGFLFLPFMSDERVSALGDLLGLFYIAQAGVVGAYMGMSAYMSRK